MLQFLKTISFEHFVLKHLCFCITYIELLHAVYIYVNTVKLYLLCFIRLYNILLLYNYIIAIMNSLILYTLACNTILNKSCAISLNIQFVLK